MEQLQSYNPHIKFILPTAPVRRLTMRGGISIIRFSFT
jgi:hypothetical protein